MTKVTKNLQGRLARVKHRDSLEDNWVETIFRYDDLGRVARVGDGETNPKVVHYAYNNSGLVTKMTYPTNTPTEIEYSYDYLGRRYEIKNKSSNRVYATNYQYNFEHQLRSRTLNPEINPYDEIFTYDFQERLIDKDYRANSDSYFQQHLQYFPGSQSQMPVEQLENDLEERSWQPRYIEGHKASNQKSLSLKASSSKPKFKVNQVLTAFQSNQDFETELYLEDNKYCSVSTVDESNTTVLILEFSKQLPKSRFKFIYQSMYGGYKIGILDQDNLFLRVSDDRFIAGNESNASFFTLEEDGEGFKLKQLLDPTKYWGLDDEDRVIFVDSPSAVTMYKEPFPEPKPDPEGYIFTANLSPLEVKQNPSNLNWFLGLGWFDGGTRVRFEPVMHKPNVYQIRILEGEKEGWYLEGSYNGSIGFTSIGGILTEFEAIPTREGSIWHELKCMAFMTNQYMCIKNEIAVLCHYTESDFFELGEKSKDSSLQSNQALLNATYKSDFIVNTKFQGSKYNNDLDVIYDYDYLGRLITSAKDSETSYQYDHNGNLNQINGSNYEYFPGSNKLQRIVDNGQTIREVTDYDNLGNITVMTNSDSKQVTFTRRVLGDLVKGVQIQDGSNITLKYDGFGRRLQKQSTTTEEYIYGRGKLPLVIKGVGGVEELLYIYDGDSIIGFEENGNTTYLLSDQLGSTRVAVDSDNNSLCSFDYDDFGKTVVASSSENAAQKVSFRYAGQWWDEELQLYHCYSRFYDPDLRRFISIDPVREGFSPYVYVGNNPINRIDPSGLFSLFKKNSGSYRVTPKESSKRSKSDIALKILEQGEKIKGKVVQIIDMIEGDDSTSEYTIISELFNQNNYGSQLQNKTSGTQPETRLHETHIGTTTFSTADSPRFTLASYLEPHRNIIEVGNINSVLQFSQLDYTLEPDFQTVFQTPESQAINDSFEQMTANITSPSYIQGGKKIAATPLLRDKVELILARRAAETGRFLTKVEEGEIREMLGI